MVAMTLVMTMVGVDDYGDANDGGNDFGDGNDDDDDFNDQDDGGDDHGDGWWWRWPFGYGDDYGDGYDNYDDGGDDFGYGGDYLWSQWFVMVVMMIAINGLLHHLFIYSCTCI